MKNSYAKKRTMLIIGSIIIIFVIIIIISTSNYWFFGIVGLLDGGKNTIRELEPLMEQYLEQKYGGEMKLWSVGRKMSGGISATARRNSLPQMDFFNIYYEKSDDDSYTFSDTYYSCYLKYLTDKKLTEISKEIFKENFESDLVFSWYIDRIRFDEIHDIDIPLDECLDIIKYNFCYSVNIKENFAEDKIPVMYELLKTLYEVEIIPSQTDYTFKKQGKFNQSSFTYQFPKNDGLIDYDDFKEEMLEKYNK